MQNSTMEADDSSLSAADLSLPQDKQSTPQVNSDYKLAHLVSQISINTAPKERAVEKTLGGPFTFLGQYEDLGIIAIALKTAEEDMSNVKNSESNESSPANEHVLQPPLHEIKGITGDILLMKVKHEEADEETEFFLDLTREEYLEFASRTDIVATVATKEKDDDIVMENEEDEDDEEEMEEYDGEEDSEDEEVGEAEMFETIMGHIVQRFVAQNGRDPDAAELLTMRRALTQKLGQETALVSSDEEGDK